MLKMKRALLYKEWIKLRYALVAFAAVSVLFAVKILLDFNYQVEFVGSKNLWNFILFGSMNPYRWGRFFPLVIGVALAFLQFIPEVTHRRIKLSFHLPVSENEIMLRLILIGNCFLLGILMLGTCCLIMGLTLVFPRELILDALITSLPSILGAVCAYNCCVMIILEPTVVYRSTLVVMSAGLTSLFFNRVSIGAYKPVLLQLSVIALLTVFAPMLSSYRFRKGVEK